MPDDPSTTPAAPAAPRCNHWEQRIVLCGLVGCLWLSVIGSVACTLLGVAVPHEVYYLGTASFAALATLVWPAGGQARPH